LCIKKGKITRETTETFIKVLSPFAPHLAEEIWEMLANAPSISFQPWPVYNKTYLIEEIFEYPISFNGKLRFRLELPLNMSTEDIEKAVLTNEKADKWLGGKTPKKVIIVPGKIVNVVI
jgi:leucyl-tRNA synthetase